MICLSQSAMQKSLYTLLFVTLSTILLFACAQQSLAPVVEDTAVPPQPNRTCQTNPPHQSTAVSETHLNLSIDVSSNNINDTIRIYQSDELIYECTHVVSDELTGAGHIFNVVIDREGEHFRFETDGIEKVWEGEIIPDETDLYTNYEDRTVEYYYAFASFSRELGWSVWLSAEHPGYE